jgi:hypothetical protein
VYQDVYQDMELACYAVILRVRVVLPYNRISYIHTIDGRVSLYIALQYQNPISNVQVKEGGDDKVPHLIGPISHHGNSNNPLLSPPPPLTIAIAISKPIPMDTNYPIQRWYVDRYGAV